ncbi:kinase D-interacting substrate of 220 kDa B-like isoform X2 [Clavelina lepadiformis]|uniref:kinase D-interacting substrate of 220 kDa B-like isoform X2 n=1 Tax=Clavelina lepadiformis TaxID=159417 RepID=UPI004042126E
MLSENDSSPQIELQEINSSVGLLHQFVSEGNLQGVKEIVDNCTLLVNRKNQENLTALHVACNSGSKALVTYLIENGANLTAKDDNEFTPLITASMKGSLECVSAVFETRFPPSLEQMDVNGWTALMWASYKGHADVVDYLLTHGANVHATVAYNMTSLLWAAGRGFLDIVEALCRKGAKVNHVDKFGNTALIWASRHGYADVISCLLNHKADPNIVGANGCSGLINAVKGNHVECVPVLLQCPKLNVNRTDQNGHSALCYAAKLGTADMASQLLDHGAYLNLADLHGDSPLIKSIKHGHVEMVKLLLSKFADINVTGKDGKTAIHLACEMGHILIVQELLKCDCKLECRNALHETPLLRAVKEGNVIITKILLSSGADVSACDVNGDTAVHLAIRSQNIQLVELLLRNPKNGRYLYQENKSGETPYDLDARSNKKILSQLFGSKGYSATAIVNDAFFDVSSCSLAEMLTEPTFETPLCVGVYAKWGSDILFLLNKIQYQIELFTTAAPALERQLPWFTFVVVLLISAFIGVFASFFSTNHVLAALLPFFSLILIVYSLLVFLYVGSWLGKWQWATIACRNLQKKEKYLKELLEICFVQQRFKSGGKVKFMFPDCVNIGSMKREFMIPDITSTLVSSVERCYGSAAFRLARALYKAPPRGREKRVFRKLCCVPAFMMAIAFILAMLIIFILLVVLYGPVHTQPSIGDDISKQMSLKIAIYVLLSVIGIIVLLSAPTIYQILSSLLRTPHKIRSTLSEEVDKNLTELASLHHAVSIIDAVKGTQTRLCLFVNGLEATDEKQLLELISSVRTIFSVKPVITVLCLDYHLAMGALGRSAINGFSGVDVKRGDYMHSLIQLPMFFTENRNKKKLTKKIDNFQSDSDADVFEQSRRRKYPKQFDVTKWLTADDCFQPINAQLIKRVASIISFTARLLRAGEKDFSWSSLSTWIVLTELWPHSTLCLLSYANSKGFQNKSLKSMYFELSQKIARHQSGDVSDAHTLQSFISSKTCSLTAFDMVNFYPFTVNLDPKLEDSIPTFTESWASHSNDSLEGSERDRASVSSYSNLSCQDVPLIDWSVDDVCFRFKSIPGLDSSNFTKYDTFVRNHNLHGLALSLCDIDELKKELHTSFGDWCLIKKFIQESRVNGNKSKHHLSFSSLATSDKKGDSATRLSRNQSNFSEEDDVIQFSTLPSTEKVAYKKAFKDYLTLHPQTTAVVDHNDSHNALVHSHVDNERYPLLNQLDINANS